MRSDFPIFETEVPLIYFDTAATAQKPRSVIEAIQNFASTKYGTVHRGVYTLSREASEAYFQVRKKVQTFINASHVEEIIFTRGTTSSLNLVAHSFGKAFIQKGDTVLVTEIEHHSNLVPWQMMCEERGAHLEFIRVDDFGDLDFAHFETLLLKKPKIVSLPHVSNTTGGVHPLAKIIKMAHHVGAKVCVDGAQAISHFPVDVRALDADFYAFSGHKLYGPTGIGILYGKKDLLEKMPPLEGGGDMIEEVTLEKTTYAPLPLKFEAGTPSILEVIGLGAAIDYVTKIGLKTICEHEKELLAYAIKKLKSIPGLTFLGNPKERCSLLSFYVEDSHPLDIATLLDVKGIALRSGHLCSQPTMTRFHLTSCLRISFGLYNTKSEIDFFLTSLLTILENLKTLQ